MVKILHKKFIFLLVFFLFSVIGYSQGYEIEKNEVIYYTPFEEQFFQIRYPNVKDHQRIVSECETTIEKSSSEVGNLRNARFLGPVNYGARTRAILVDRANSNNIFAGGTTGGLWKSINSGAGWNPVNDQQENLNVSCITQNPFNGNIIYYGTGEFTGNHTGVGGSGIFKSIDGGGSFSKLLSTNLAAFDYCQVIKHSLVDSNTIFVGTNENGLFKTTNGGNTFTKIFIEQNRVSDIECFADGRVWVGIIKEGIFESMTGDSGTFYPLASGLPSQGFSRVEIAYCDSFPDTGYAMYGDTLPSFNSGLVGIFNTIDGGLSWNEIPNPDIDYNFYFPRLTLCMAVKPDNPDFLVCGGADLVFSEDGGTSWSLINNVHIDQHTIVFDPNNFSKIYSGNDGGIVRHSAETMDSEVDYLNNGYNIQQFYAGAFFPVGNSCIAGSQDNYTQIARDDDSVFIKINDVGVNGSYSLINQQDVNISYSSGNNGTIVKSENTMANSPNYYLVLNQLDADSDMEVDDQTWNINPFEINLLDGNQLYFITKERVWRTVDGAENWQPLISNVTDAPYAIGISNDTFPTVFIGGENGLFIRVDSAYNSVPGNEINLSNSLPNAVTSDFISSISFHPETSNIVYVAFSNYSSEPRIWKVANANSSSPIWNNISGNLPNNLSVTCLEVDPLHPDSIFVAATDFGLYTTIDAGLNWVKELDIPNVSIPNIRLRKTDRKLFIFTHGRGVWIAELPEMTVNSISLNANESGFNIFPNPNDGKFKLECNLDNYKNFKVTIADITNRVIFENEPFILSNKFELNIDLSNQSNGIYFLTVNRENRISTFKIIKQ